MAVSTEMRDQIREFFKGTAGSIVLARLHELQDSNNDLRAVMNSVQNEVNPQLLLAAASGRVDAYDRVFQLLDELQEEVDS